uniref:Prolyl 4-hydroxylase alpha subunit domain-containing protein n=1 Tax=Ciona savignyi TaxID=51511 RepID=H2YI65_CIOSA
MLKDGQEKEHDNFQGEMKMPEQGSMKMTRELNIGDGHKAWVIDNAISREDFHPFVEILTQGDQDYTFVHQNYSKSLEASAWNFGLSPWLKHLDLEFFNSTNIWHRVSPLVENLLKKPVKLESGKIEYLRALDAIPPKGHSLCAPNRYILTFFLQEAWKLNSYGQLSFYTMGQNKNMSDEPRLEITESVHPHAFRATLWPACHVVLFRAPSVNFFQHLMQLHVVLTTDLESNEEITTPASGTRSSAKTKEEFGNFRFTNKDKDRTIDYDKCYKKSYYDKSKNRPIHIYDGLFTSDELRSWKSHIIACNAKLNPFDPEPSEGHDNIQWMAPLNVDNFQETDMWKRMFAFLKHVTNETEWFPYDVALNYVRSGDHSRIHPDSERHQEELTLLLYLTEDFTPNDFAETTWVVMKKDDGILSYTGPGGEVYETIAAVAPKFGRVALFRGKYLC